jgi:hypothetical protein
MKYQNVCVTVTEQWVLKKLYQVTKHLEIHGALREILCT